MRQDEGGGTLKFDSLHRNNTDVGGVQSYTTNLISIMTIVFLYIGFNALPVIVDLRLERYELRCSSSVTLSMWSTPWNHTAAARRRGTLLLPGAQVRAHKKVPLLCGSLTQGQTPNRMSTAERTAREKFSVQFNTEQMSLPTW